MAEIILRGLEGMDFFPSKIIEWDTRCPISHIETQLQTTVEGAPVYLGALFKGGVWIRKGDDPAYGKHFKEHFFRIEVTPEQWSTSRDFLYAQLKKPYDWRAICAWGLGNRDWMQDDSWFCSELVAASLRFAGIPALNWSLPITRLSPRDVVLSPLVKTAVVTGPPKLWQAHMDSQNAINARHDAVVAFG